MLTHIITKENVARYPGVMEKVFHQRYQMFVETLGWSRLNRIVPYDVDAYDHAETQYIVGLLPGGVPFWHSRFNPTTGPHQLEEGGPFRKYAADEPPRGPDVWEGSRSVGGLLMRPDHPEDLEDPARILFDPSDEADAKRARKELFGRMARGRVATQEFLIKRGAKQCLGIADSNLMGRMAEMGWNHRPLGPPIKYPEGEANAVVFEASEDILAENRRAWNVVDKQTYEAPPGDAPFPFLIFDTYQNLDRVQRGSFLKRLEPLLGPCPHATNCDAAYDYLLRLETPKMEKDALRIADLVITEIANDASTAKAI